MSRHASMQPEEDLPRFHLVHGQRIGTVTPLSGQGPWLFGRDPAANLCLAHDPFVSTRHAERGRGARRAASSWRTRTAATARGWIGSACPAARRLENGSVVRIGRTLLVFRKPG